HACPLDHDIAVLLGPFRLVLRGQRLPPTGPGTAAGGDGRSLTGSLPACRSAGARVVRLQDGSVGGRPPHREAVRGRTPLRTTPRTGTLDDQYNPLYTPRPGHHA